MDLAARLPDELLERILVAGITDEGYGHHFGAKCMLLARWLQSFIAPLLYATVVIDTEPQLCSFLLTLENDKDNRGYITRKLVRSLVITEGQSDGSDIGIGRDRLLWASKILTITHTLNESTWKELHIPTYLINYASSALGEISKVRYRMPPSTTYVYWRGYWMSGYLDSSAVTKLRFQNFALSFRSMVQVIRHLVNRKPKTTHLSVTSNSWPTDILDIVKLVDAVNTEHPNLQCVVVIKIPSESPTDNLEDPEAIRTGRQLMKIKAPKLVMWERSEENNSIYNSYDSEKLWSQAERELAEAEPDLVDWEKLMPLHLPSHH